MGNNKKASKKRLLRRKLKKPNTKQSAKPQATNHNPAEGMSRLEYQQALMDPRFRAAMMGFNNPAGGNPMQMNSMLHDQTTKSNELTRQLTMQTDLANAKLKNQKLKDELKMTKLDHQHQMTNIMLKNDNEFKQAELRNLQQKAVYDLQIQQLNTEIASQRQTLEEQQVRHKQKQERLKAEFKMQSLEEQARHEREMQPLEQAIEVNQQSIAFSKQIHDNAMSMMKAQNDLVLSEMKAGFDSTVQPMQEHTQALNNLTQLEKERHEQKNALNDAVTKALVAEYKAATQPTVEVLNARSNDLTNKLKLLDTSIKQVESLKDAKFRLNQAEIRAIHEPIIAALNTKADALQNDMALNKTIYDEIKKQNDIKTKIAQAEQVIDPAVRSEYEEKVKTAKMETHQLELINKQAEAAAKAYQEKEAVRSQIITNAAQLLNDFNVEDIDKPEFTQTLIDEADKFRKQHAEYQKKLEATHLAIEYQNLSKDTQLKQIDAEAKLAAGSPENYAAIVNEYSKQQHLLAQKTKATEVIGQMIDKERDIASSNTMAVTNRMLEFYDKYPWAKSKALEIAKTKHGTDGILYPEDFADVIGYVKELHRSNAEVYSTLPYDVTDKLQPKDVNLVNLEQYLKARNIDAQQQRFNMHQQLESLRAELASEHQQKQEAQSRFNQTRDLNIALYNRYSQLDAGGYVETLKSVGITSDQQLTNLLNGDQSNQQEQPFAQASDNPNYPAQPY